MFKRELLNLSMGFQKILDVNHNEIDYSQSLHFNLDY